MPDLIDLLSAYDQCTPVADAGLLTQVELFACNETDQQAKRLFLDGDLRRPGSVLTLGQNTRASLSFKTREMDKAALVRVLKSRRSHRLQRQTAAQDRNKSLRPGLGATARLRDTNWECRSAVRSLQAP